MFKVRNYYPGHKLLVDVPIRIQVMNVNEHDDLSLLVTPDELQDLSGQEMIA
ncbi:hypothetical protein [Paenibacillus selenitireducens]|uniref:hypothetical protein n=1 Tax=Paenibacillus selenitireducens TaxID=1324314 RepID=UPI00130202AA|nr:hypothetical protein [Paenibacillus selenitireducens]